MSNRSQSPRSSYLEEMQAFNAWKLIADIPESAETNDAMNGFNVNETQSQVCMSNSNIWNTHPICNQFCMQHENNDKKNEEYKISSSLKTIWNNESENRQTTSNHQQDISENVAQQMKKNTQTPVNAGYLDKLDMTDNIALVANLLNGNHGNSLKGRAITAARNGLQYNNNNNYMSDLGIENMNINQICTPITTSSILNPREPMEEFLQKLQLVVQNGFLSRKILSEPIAPETYELVQMLIHYVMEYGKTKVYAQSCPISPSSEELNTHIQIIFYKINLIQKEIATCQSKYLEHERIQQEILDSFSTFDGLLRQSQPTFKQFGIPMTREGNKVSETANNIDAIVRKPFESIEPQSQRFSQRNLNPYTQQENVKGSGNFMFLPKAKNIENRNFYERNQNNFSRRDGNFTAN